MQPKILFPCDPCKSDRVDSNFENELKISNLLGFEALGYDHDLLADEGKIKFSNIKEGNYRVILRGWMLTPTEYEKLFKSLSERGHYLYTNPGAYAQCHYLKNSYKFIEPYTAKTLFSDKFDKETLGEMFDQFPDGIVLKDYVKSEKFIPGLFRIPKETTHEQLEDVVNRFIEARGKLFNEGVAFREFVELKKYAGEVNEWRIFVFKGKVAAAEQNSNIDSALIDLPKPPENLINAVAYAMRAASVFYTVDFAEKENGGWMVVETGDGQVSGLAPNQNPIGLYNAFINTTKVEI